MTEPVETSQRDLAIKLIERQGIMRLSDLKRVAREKQTDYQLILRRYAIERLLHRLSISPYRDQFILKGAMLFATWIMGCGSVLGVRGSETTSSYLRERQQ